MGYLISFKLYIELLKYVVLISFIFLIFGLGYFYLNSEELECPDVYLKKINRYQFSGIVEGKSMTCEKERLKILFRSSSERQAIILPREYSCLLNAIKIGDSISKDSSSYIIKVINSTSKEFTYNCMNVNKCDCESQTLYPNGDHVYTDLITKEEYSFKSHK